MAGRFDVFARAAASRRSHPYSLGMGKKRSRKAASDSQRSLKPYQAKRNFDRSPEPTGTGKAGRQQSADHPRRFCVQKHLASHLHYDFRLEHAGVLLSWAVPKGPSLNPQDKRLAMMVEDHPLDYIDFEGVIPEGYGAGIVMVWDEGTWQPAEGFEDVDAALKKGELKFTLNGVKLKGSWVLVRTRGTARSTRGGTTSERKPDTSRSWLLIKHRDHWSGPIDIDRVAPLSVKSGHDFAHILAADDPAIWPSHQPGRGGRTGVLLRRIIHEAARIRAERQGG